MNKKQISGQILVETGMADEREENILRVDVDGWNVLLELPTKTKPSASVEECGGFTLVHFDFPKGTLGEYHINVQQPFIDIARSWAGMIHCWKGLELTSVALNFNFESSANNNLPVLCNYSREGLNRGVVGMLDHVPSTKINQRPILDIPPMETLQLRFSRSRDKGGFRETLVIYRKKLHFAEAVRRFLKFCREKQGVKPMAAPEWGRDPVWCSWYSHLYTLTQDDVEKQIPFLAKMGIKTVLIDASWFQSRDAGIGCVHESGIYNMNMGFFPDFQKLVWRIHDAGLKLMLWCAPLHIGLRSHNREAMAPYCVLKGGERTNVLCPFCEESQAHASELMQRLMSEYRLDGIKLDFLDQGGVTCEDPAHDHGDGNTGLAMRKIFGTLRDSVLKVNPDAVIEYRIRYSTMVTLPFANCHRGNDAPYDSDYIRRENLFLRLYCEFPSAVWSDYAYWHAQEKIGNISMMLGTQIFSGGVPTMSVNLTKCGVAEKLIVGSWMKFYRAHRDALAKAELTVNSADSIMSVTSLENKRYKIAFTLLAGQHVPARIKLNPGIRNVWILNASAEKTGETKLTAGKISLRAKITGRNPVCIQLR